MSNDARDIAAEILSPQRGDQFLTLDGPALDNVTWQDFSSVNHILPPVYLADSPPVQAPPSGADIDLALELESDDLDTTEFRQFLSDLRSAVLTGIKTVFESRNPEVRTRRYSQYTAYSESTGVFTVIWRSRRSEQSYSFDLRAILDGYMTALSPIVLADLFECYDYFDSQDGNLSYRPPHPYFAQIQAQFAPASAMGAAFETYKRVLAGSVHAADLQRKWALVKQHITVWSGIGSSETSLTPDPMPVPLPVVPEPYAFRVFAPNSCNLGLRLVYRQEWRLLGNQRGEIVKTIALGPKQTEKVSTRIIRRTSRSMGSEDMRSSESTTETSQGTKDSSEVIRDAQQSLGVNASISTGYSTPLGAEVSISGGMQAEAKNSVKDTASNLSETMQKTASRMRSETRVTVETATESEAELNSTSEIQNPNEEIALTYVYSKLQTQYEVFTGLAEVHPVLMVAESVPRPEEVDFAWVRRHHWIIARTLLDASFADALNSIANEAQSPLTDALTARLDQVLEKSLGHLGAVASAGGNLSLSNIDVVQESQRGYRESIKEQSEKVRQNYLLEQKRERLYQHLRDNILHYCRSIWSHEDPEQRVLRYAKQGAAIPQDWTFSPDDVGIDQLLQVLAEEGDLDGVFAGSEETVAVADLINPAGPIGYYGNYALFYLRRERMSASLRSVFNIVKQPYSFRPSLLDPQGLTVLGEAELVDPVLRELAEANPPHSLQDFLFSDDVRAEMVSYVPELRLLERAGRLPVDDLSQFKSHYAEYLFRKEMSRRFLVDSDNLLIDIEPGTGSALEPFKLAHRSVDVSRAMAERDRLLLENERRRALLAEQRLGDPDIERVTMINGNAATSVIVDGGDGGTP